MNTYEKIFSLFAILFAVVVLTLLAIFPDLRQLNRLLVICLMGLAVNVGLLFITLRDIFLRQFSDQNARYIWLILVLFIWPVIIVYLFRHGFKPRT